MKSWFAAIASMGFFACVQPGPTLEVEAQKVERQPSASQQDSRPNQDPGLNPVVGAQELIDAPLPILLADVVSSVEEPQPENWERACASFEASPAEPAKRYLTVDSIPMLGAGHAKGAQELPGGDLAVIVARFDLNAQSELRRISAAGTQLWSHLTGQQFAAVWGPVVAGSDIWFGSPDHSFILRVSANGAPLPPLQLCAGCLLKSGLQSTSGSLVGALTHADGSTALVAFSPNGTLKWEQPAPVYRAALDATGNILALEWRGALTITRYSPSGAREWSVSPRGSYSFASTPLLAAGPDGSAFLLGAVRGELSWGGQTAGDPYSPMYRGVILAVSADGCATWMQHVQASRFVVTTEGLVAVEIGGGELRYHSFALTDGKLNGFIALGTAPQGGGNPSASTASPNISGDAALVAGFVSTASTNLRPLLHRLR